MATLTQYLELGDGVSGPLYRMVAAAKELADSQNIAAAALAKTEQHANGLGGVMSKLGGITNSALGAFTLGNIAATGIMTIGQKISELPGKLMAASDAYSGMMARLKLVTGSQEEAIQMNEMIYQSALRARGSYDGMADSVSKIAMTAKAAFPDAKTVVPFVEGIQKLFTIGGTSVEGQKNAMLQLTQALGSGKLQGDEFRSIAEAAPLIEQMIAKEMGVAQGELKQLGADGEITADIIRNAILHNMDEINRDFAEMPLTWEQAWQQIGTISSKAMQPVYDTLKGLANSPAMASFVESFKMIMPVVAAGLSSAIDGLTTLGVSIWQVGSYMYDWIVASWVVFGDTVAAVFPYVVGAMAGLGVWLVLLAANYERLNYQEQLNAAIKALSAAKTWAVTTATAAWTTVTKGATIAQKALNLALLLNPIGIVVGLVALVIGAFVAWAIATNGVRNTIAQAFGAIAGVAESVINFMIDRINGLIEMLNSLGKGINSVFGTDIKMMGTIHWKAEGWKKGAEKFVQEFDTAKTFGILTPNKQEILGVDPNGVNGDAIAANTGETAKNTGKLAEAMDLMDEDLKIFREAADRESINRYTTARVDISLGGVTNNLSGEADENRFITHLVEDLREAVAAGGEAVQT